MQEDVELTRSEGRGSGGKSFYYIRPLQKCYNRSRRVGGFTSSEINQKINNCIRKWYYPKVVFYKIDGHIIGSNSKENALKEYWRICDLRDVGVEFEVEQV